MNKIIKKEREGGEGKGEPNRKNGMEKQTIYSRYDRDTKASQDKTGHASLVYSNINEQ